MKLLLAIALLAAKGHAPKARPGIHVEGTKAGAPVGFALHVTPQRGGGASVHLEVTRELKKVAARDSRLSAAEYRALWQKLEASRWWTLTDYADRLDAADSFRMHLDDGKRANDFIGYAADGLPQGEVEAAVAQATGLDALIEKASH